MGVKKDQEEIFLASAIVSATLFVKVRPREQLEVAVTSLSKIGLRSCLCED